MSYYWSVWGLWWAINKRTRLCYGIPADCVKGCAGDRLWKADGKAARQFQDLTSRCWTHRLNRSVACAFGWIGSLRSTQQWNCTLFTDKCDTYDSWKRWLHATKHSIILKAQCAWISKNVFIYWSSPHIYMYQSLSFLAFSSWLQMRSDVKLADTLAGWRPLTMCGHAAVNTDRSYITLQKRCGDAQRG